MNSINIYSLTRISDPERLARLERQLSKRGRFLKIKEWETEGLGAFVDKLCEVSPEASSYEFFYSFTMPKLGKEFDLIRVSDDTVVNIELKSGNVSDETIRNQLIQNKYYLSTLGLNTHFYTYVSNLNRLVRLSNTEKLVETDWDELAVVLKSQKNCYEGHIEDLFKEELYLISPLSDPDRFLRSEYFLTSQQKDIKKQILRITEEKKRSGMPPVLGFTGLPGTGKTLLLYDLAMQLSRFDRVCVLHFGSHEKELEQLDERLKRIDFYYCEAGEKILVEGTYTAILVDEGHRIDEFAMNEIRALSAKWNAPIIVSYDREDSIAGEERLGVGAELIENLEGFTRFCLTNKIRLNGELSAFINCLMSFKGKLHRKDFPSVSLAYANNLTEAGKLLDNYKADGYMYIKDPELSQPETLAATGAFSEIEAHNATCKAFDKVVMFMDETFFYDGGGNLRNKATPEGRDHRIRKLFHGLSRAKSRIALVVCNNPAVFDVVLFILQH